MQDFEHETVALVSIIVPIYNVEAFLPTCIASLLAQTFHDIEVLLIDDGSTDTCASVCLHYAGSDSRVRYFYKDNGGLSDARNYGLERARGQWVLFIDSDDYVYDGLVEALLRATQKGEVDIVQAGFECVDEEGRPVECIYHGKDTDGTEDSRGALLRLYGSDVGAPYVTAWNKLYRRTLFEDIRYPQGRVYEDVATTPYLFNRARQIVFVGMKLFVYRVRAGSISHLPEFDERELDILDFLDEQSSLVRSYGDRELDTLYLNARLAHFEARRARRLSLCATPDEVDSILLKRYRSLWRDVAVSRLPLLRKAKYFKKAFMDTL